MDTLFLAFRSCNKVKVIKILSTLSLLPTVYLCKFGQNPITGSEDNALKQSYTDAGTDADGIHTKINMPPWIGGGRQRHKFAYICKSEVCSHDIFKYKFAHGV